MKRPVILIMLSATLQIFMFQGCGLFGRVEKEDAVFRSSADDRLEMKEQNGVQRLKELHTVALSTDSLQSDFEVVIFPLGRFSFSPGKGFEGEAERILLKGSRVKVATHAAVKSGQERVDQTRQSSIKQSNAAKEELKQAHKKTAPALNWLIIGLAVLIGAGIVLKRL